MGLEFPRTFLLAVKFFSLEPGARFKYAAIGLLFVNISVGGTLTHYAAPPVLMAAGPWEWGTVHMLVHFGWKAVLAILINTGLLFFLGFGQISSPYQNRVDLKAPLLVGFFLAGLVIHGGLQAWWIAPVLGNLKEIPLMIMATGLTAFNDNAAITYLSTLVPGLTAELKYAVVVGGGLTVIANAPNPAGQSLLKKYFDNGVAPAGLLKAALLPTVVVLVVFLLFR